MYSQVLVSTLFLFAITLSTATTVLPSDITAFQTPQDTITEFDVNGVVRTNKGGDDDDDEDDDKMMMKGKGMTPRGPVCTIAVGRKKFNRCRVCIKACLTKFGKKVPVRGGRKYDDDDDDDDCDDKKGCNKSKTMKTKLVCAGSRKCLICTKSCKRKFGGMNGIKKGSGKGKGGKDDEEDEDDH